MAFYTVILKATHVQNNQEISNVFGYADDPFTTNPTTANLNDLADSFIANVWIHIRDIVSSLTRFVSITVKAEVFGIEIVNTTIDGVVGTRPADADVSQTAASFKMVRGTNVTKSGSKRIGVLSADDWTPLGIPADSTVEARVTNIETAFALQLPGLLGSNYTPVVTRWNRTVTPPAVIASTFVASCVYRGSGTQNSRKSLLP